MSQQNLPSTIPTSKAIVPTSLTPESRNAETTHECMMEGVMNGLLTLIPTIGAVMIALKTSPTFVARTNWQSRTAISIMPALFVAALTSEQKLVSRMHQIAAETEHNVLTVHWAEEQMKQQQQQQQQQQQSQGQGQNGSLKTMSPSVSTGNEYVLRDLYNQSLLNRDENVCVVPGDKLAWYHRTANFIGANPIKVLASLAVPSVAWIYYGNSTKQHLEFSHKLLHTRVFGQFATITLLLGVMGFKDFMDKNGRFISQAESDKRVNEMQLVRLELIRRLQTEHEHELEMQREIQEAHDADVREHHNNHTTGTKKHHHPHSKKKGSSTTNKDESSSSSSNSTALNVQSFVEDA